MHRCLLIREVLCSIFEYHATSRDLATLAQTCRWFSDPALDILWRDICNLSTLVKYTVPSHIWDEETSVRSIVETKTLLFLETPVASDWDRFAYYASRICTLGTDFGSDGRDRMEKIDPSVFNHFCSYRPSSPLLPRLRVLVWNIPNPEALPYVHIFLGAGLQYLGLSIFGHHSSHDIVATLSEIPGKCPSLKKIHFNDRTKGPLVASAKSRFFGALNGLRTLHLVLGCRSLDCETLLQLSKLPVLDDLSLSIRSPLSGLGGLEACMSSQKAGLYFVALKRLSISTACSSFSFDLLNLVRLSPLQTLHLDYCEFDAPDLPDPVSGSQLLAPAFQQLQVLSVVAPHTLFCTALLRSTQLSALQKLNVQLGIPADCDLENLLDAVSGCCSPSSFRSITVSQSSCFIANYYVPEESLRALLAFKRLTQVVLLPGCRFDLDDALMGDIGMSWKDLESVVIGTNCRKENRSRVTLDGLVPLARYCRALEHVEFPINALHVPLLSESEFDPEDRNESVKALNFGYSAISHDSVPRVSAILKHLFPNLQHLDVECIPGTISRVPDGEPLYEHDPWDDVRRSVVGCQC